MVSSIYFVLSMSMSLLTRPLTSATLLLLRPLRL
jgi:hypothetical protein